jgi:hypothetical protein
MSCPLCDGTGVKTEPVETHRQTPESPAEYGARVVGRCYRCDGTGRDCCDACGDGVASVVEAWIAMPGARTARRVTLCLSCAFAKAGTSPDHDGGLVWVAEVAHESMLAAIESVRAEHGHPSLSTLVVPHDIAEVEGLVVEPDCAPGFDGHGDEP